MEKSQPAKKKMRLEDDQGQEATKSEDKKETPRPQMITENPKKRKVWREEKRTPKKARRNYDIKRYI